MAEYQGMRWFKTDFQVQTPEDAAHWADNDTNLLDPRRPLIAPQPDADGLIGPSKPDEARIQEIAKTFLRRCHSLNLEVIGITDHNFSKKTETRDWFLTHLVEQNRGVAKELGRPPLSILPGFEVDIGYHVLCLFEPARQASHVWRVNRILTKLGLAEDERFIRAGQPAPLRYNGENVGLKTLLEVVQDKYNGIVIAAHSDQNDGLLVNPRNIGDYQNTGLFALEVTASPPVPPILEILQGRNRDWGRQSRPPAYVMSSDAKSLRQEPDGSIPPNCLGYRHTWVRMTEPSIESLRQAFLDPQSRIRLLGNCPSDSQLHPRIKRLSVTGAAFVADQELVFSEGLNCIIGGRGTGKSSLVEYLRFALELDVQPSEHAADALTRKRDQLRESIKGQEARIEVEFEVAGGAPDTLVYNLGTSDSRHWHISNRDVEDIGTVVQQLQAQFFSQGELSRLTGKGGGRSHVLELIDKSSDAALIELESSERDTRERLKSLFQSTRDVFRIQSEIKVASQEAVELGRQLLARASVQADAVNNQRALQARTYLESLQSHVIRDVARVTDLISTTSSDKTNLPKDLAGEWPQQDWLGYASDTVEGLRGILIERLTSAVDDFKRDATHLFRTESVQPVLQSIESAQATFRAACEAKGLLPNDISRLEEFESLRQKKLAYIEDKGRELEQAKTNAQELETRLQKLHELWRAQHSLRVKTASEMELAVASQTLRISVKYMGDKDSFSALWQKLTPRDGRSKLGRRWEEIGDDLFKNWDSRNSEASPWETLEAARSDPAALVYLYGEMMEDLQPALLRYIDSDDVRPIWESVRLSRVRDGIDVELLREDGTSAGTMNGALSEGQRNTVLLNLLLSRGIGPIVIDQPEDELDSTFIYKTLVQDLRTTKGKRQVIIVTHNANLPVNGDAELIYALEAREGRGHVLTQGGLDKSKVALAVLEIMEGSEQAFKRRGEKYHF